MGSLGRIGRAISNSGKYLGASLAIILVKRKLRRRPHDWSLWLVLARLHETGCQWTQALDALERARQLSPENPVVERELARVQARVQETRKTEV